MAYRISNKLVFRRLGTMEASASNSKKKRFRHVTERLHDTILIIPPDLVPNCLAAAERHC